MVQAFQVLVTRHDEDEDGNEPADAVLRVMDRALAITGYVRHKQRDYWLSLVKFRAFRGPWPVQFLLTPLFCFNGILLSRGDARWMDADTDKPRLRVRPLVPAEFWVDIHFKNRSDAQAVAGLIEPFWLPQRQRGPGGWLQALRRWPEGFAAPFFMIPVGTGLIQHGKLWTAIGFGAFFTFVVTGMILAALQDAKEQRRWQREQPGGSPDQ